MKSSILVIGEHTGTQIAPVTLELVALAKILQTHTHGRIHLFLAGGPDLAEEARPLSKNQGIDVTLLNTAADGTAAEQASVPMDIALKHPPLEWILALRPSYVCVAHTPNGLDIAPALAVLLNAACITGVEGIVSNDQGLQFVRTILNDKITAKVVSDAAVTVLTVVSGAFKSTPSVPESYGIYSLLNRSENLSDNLAAYQFHGIKKDGADTSALNSADVIVAAGNGIKQPEDLEIIYRLSRLFPKSAVAGSRPVCDKKWLKHSQQVGVTGASVKPKLYIACGISGASQHVIGMRDSRLIVAVNTDPHAAIFNVSDICIIEDLTRFIPHFINMYVSTTETGETSDAGSIVC